MKNNCWDKISLSVLISALGFGFGFYPVSVLAKTGISLAAGHGLANIVPVRIGFQKAFEKEIHTDHFWPIWAYWEGALYSMNGKACPKRPGSHKHLYAAVLAGALRFERQEPLSRLFPYVELGIGVSWVNHREIGGRDLGTPFLFEDRLSFGVRFGENRQYDLSYRLVHFSNAYMGPCNHGINLHMVALGYWFN
jgi:lipid A 3-O-deacylase